MKDLNVNELLDIDGGANIWKVVGGGLTVVGSVIGGVASGGSGVIPAIVGVAVGIAMIGDGLND